MWIDARDEIPGGYRDVLVFTTHGFALAHYSQDWEQWQDDGGDLLDCEVTHWQPLPMPPRERKYKPQTARTCGDCKNWQDGSCNLPRSPRFTDTTSATDGCTPNKKARADWI